jgi:sugar O-acyltransferase (sialic acid O-acetyltransferase NeuD family)
MQVVLIGAGGHARVVIDAARSSGAFDVVAVVDARLELKATRFEGVEIVGDEASLDPLRTAGVGAALLGVGSVDVGDVRCALYTRIAAMGFEFPVVVHRAATVAPSATIGPASVVFAGAIVNPGARIGTNVIVNTAAIVEHDVTIEDHAHVSPGAHLAGGVTIGPRSHIGIGSTILQGVRIGEAVVVGAGAVVLHDVADGMRVAGVPARPIQGSDKT